jgi:hypothetical protein
MYTVPELEDGIIIALSIQDYVQKLPDDRSPHPA